jgi:hypothetical protein
MRRPFHAAALLLLAAAAIAAEGDPLASHRWEQRVLLVFGDDGQRADLRRLEESLSRRECDLDDRDMIIGHFPARGPARLAGRPLSASAGEALRERLQVTPDTVLVVLIGKDGGVKLRVDEAPDLEDVFHLIDGMPMRMSEMETRGRPCPR